MISSNSIIPTIQHGGNLAGAIKQYKIPKENWIDLSTGISPWPYSFQTLPELVWHELPQPHDELLNSAATYYKVKQHCITATSGSQIAIRLIPHFFEPSCVAIPSLGYQEHAASWEMANHKIIHYQDVAELFELISKKRVEHVVIINPNNPSGEKFNSEILIKIISQVSGVCVVDEAFIDYYDDNEDSANDCNDLDANESSSIHSATKLLNQHNYENLIILRSVGKFFGLAGLRLGFVIGLHPCLQAFNSLLQPWSISHASQYIGIQALNDKQWQKQQRARIKEQQLHFQVTLNCLFANNLEDYSVVEAGLFNTVFSSNITLLELHKKLAKQGVWTRLSNEKNQASWLRFGLPENIIEAEQRFQRL